MPQDASEAPRVHPLIAAMEKAEALVEIRGFLGTSESAVVRLYPALDPSAYIEIPRSGIVHMEGPEGTEPSQVRVFVNVSQDLLQVQKRRVPASAFTAMESGYQVNPPVVLPPVRPAPTFWTCAGQCEGIFAGEVSEILILQVRALSETDPQRQAMLLAQVEKRKTTAISALLVCLTECLSKYPHPQFMAVPSDSPPGYSLERFSLPRLHSIIVTRHLGSQP